MNQSAKETASKMLDIDLEEQKEKLKTKLSNLLGKSASSIQYHRRLDTIFRILKEKLMYNGNYKKLLKNADFYQKVEMFMNYEEEKVSIGDDSRTVITSDIYTLIGEVYKSMYINFILSFLDDEKDFPLPYFGKLRIKEIDRYNPLYDKNVHYFYGRVYLDEALRKDLKKIDKEDKIEIIDDALKHTRKILTEKIF